MGWLAREFAAPSDGLTSLLHRAYADEWFAHFNYFTVSHRVVGPSAASLSALMRLRSEAALSRAGRLAQRLQTLGEELPGKLPELVEHASDKPFKLPESLDDVEGLLKAVLDAERTTMRLQRRIYDEARERDPVTASLALQLLIEAEQGEQELETLLGNDAPEMDGT